MSQGTPRAPVRPLVKKPQVTITGGQPIPSPTTNAGVPKPPAPKPPSDQDIVNKMSAAKAAAIPALTKPKEPKAEKPPKAEAPAVPITGPRLFNVITIQDFYIVALDHDDARRAANEIIASGGQKPYEQVAYETTKQREIRASWQDQPPWISSEVTDYEPVETDTCGVLWQRYYSKA